MEEIKFSKKPTHLEHHLQIRVYEKGFSNSKTAIFPKTFRFKFGLYGIFGKERGDPEDETPFPAFRRLTCKIRNDFSHLLDPTNNNKNEHP